MLEILKIALSEYGTKEIPGEKHNPDVLKYSKETGQDWVTTDEIPWCSNFVNWCSMKAGYEYTKKANARSWLDIGFEPFRPEIGDIVVLKRGNDPKSGHTGFLIKRKNGKVWILGGNQRDEVNISVFNENDVLKYVRLNKIKP